MNFVPTLPFRSPGTREVAPWSLLPALAQWKKEDLKQDKAFLEKTVQLWSINSLSLFYVSSRNQCSCLNLIHQWVLLPFIFHTIRENSYPSIEKFSQFLLPFRSAEHLEEAPGCEIRGQKTRLGTIELVVRPWTCDFMLHSLISGLKKKTRKDPFISYLERWYKTRWNVLWHFNFLQVLRDPWNFCSFILMISILLHILFTYEMLTLKGTCEEFGLPFLIVLVCGQPVVLFSSQDQ